MIKTDPPDFNSENAMIVETKPKARQIYDPLLTTSLPTSTPDLTSTSTTTTFITIFTTTTTTLPSQSPRPTTQSSKNVTTSSSSTTLTTLPSRRPQHQSFGRFPPPTFPPFNPIQKTPMVSPTTTTTFPITPTPTTTTTFPTTTTTTSSIASFTPITFPDAVPSIINSTTTSIGSPVRPAQSSQKSSSPTTLTPVGTLNATILISLTSTLPSPTTPATSVLGSFGSVTLSKSQPVSTPSTTHSNNATTSGQNTITSTLSVTPISKSQIISDIRVSIITPTQATTTLSNAIVPFGSSSSAQSISTALSAPSRTTHEPSTTSPVTSRIRSTISSSTWVPLDVPPSSSPVNTTHVLGTKGFFDKPGATAGTFIGVGLFLITGITFIILVCKRRKKEDHKYRRLLRGIVDENEIAGLTDSVSFGSRTNVSTITGDYHPSNQSGSSGGLLDVMEEITPRPSLTRPRSGDNQPNFSSRVPETAMSSLVTLPTFPDDDDSPVDPIDPFGPHRYSTAPDPFRTPRASINPYLQTPDIEAAVKWMSANEIPTEEMGDQASPANNDNDVDAVPELYAREEVALPAEKIADISWLEFSFEKTEL